MEFTSVIDMKKKIDDIIESNNFGEDIQILSDFIEAPAMFLIIQIVYHTHIF